VWERLPTKSPVKRANKKPSAKSYDTSIAVVTGVLEGYAEKAVFRGFSAHPGVKGQATYRMVWHHDRPFEMVLDAGAKTLQFPEVLPGVPARSPMYHELQGFIRERQSGEMPEHRSVNPRKARLALANKRGIVSVRAIVKDGDFDYATRKIIQMVHEIFLIFLVDGSYYEYMVEHLGLDPDRY
jgi:hypothetical protein